MAASASLSSLPAIFCANRSPTKSFPGYNPVTKKNLVSHLLHHERTMGRLIVTAVTKDSRKSEENRPSWTNPDSNELPPWAKDEGRPSTSEESFEIPFYVYLLASAITAIAAIGSVFEYSSKNPVFGILNSDSIFYTPVLGFFAFTGIPTSVFLWFKSVKTANKEAEEQDKRDGFR